MAFGGRRTHEMPTVVRVVWRLWYTRTAAVVYPPLRHKHFAIFAEWYYRYGTKTI